MRYAPHMEPMTETLSWGDALASFALAFWPVWVVLLALCVVKLASRLGYMAPDEYEDPDPRDFDGNINAKWRD